MKEINIYILVFLFGFFIVSCDKDDEDTPELKENNHNGYAIKSVEGHNEKWGDYTLTYSYDGKKLDSIVRFNSKNEILEKIVASYESKKIYISSVIREIISYEKENEDGETEVKKDTSYIDNCRIYRIFDKNNMLESESIFHYGRVEDFNPEYPKYEIIDKIKFLYEYDLSGRIMKIRTPNYTEENQPVKIVFSYTDDRIDKVRYYVQNEIDWQLNYRQLFEYNGEDLLSIKTLKNDDEDLVISFDKNGVLLSKDIKDPDFFLKEMTYKTDDKGNVTEINWPNGDYQKITYIKSDCDVCLKSVYDSYFRFPDIMGQLDYNKYFNYMFEK